MIATLACAKNRKVFDNRYITDASGVDRIGSKGGRVNNYSTRIYAAKVFSKIFRSVTHCRFLLNG